MPKRTRRLNLRFAICDCIGPFSQLNIYRSDISPERSEPRKRSQEGCALAVVRCTGGPQLVEAGGCARMVHLGLDRSATPNADRRAFTLKSSSSGRAISSVQAQHSPPMIFPRRTFGIPFSGSKAAGRGAQCASRGSCVPSSHIRPRDGGLPAFRFWSSILPATPWPAWRGGRPWGIVRRGP